MIKKNLTDIINNPKGKLVAVDLDGTLCEGEYWGGEQHPQPKKEMIEFVNNLYMKGAHIIIYTARHWTLLPDTIYFLDKYGVRFHGIVMQRKPGADLYIDDKALNVVDVLFSNT